MKDNNEKNTAGKKRLERRYEGLRQRQINPDQKLTKLFWRSFPERRERG